DRRDVRLAHRHRQPDRQLGREFHDAPALRGRDPARGGGDPLQRVGALAGSALQHLAHAMTARDPALSAAIEVAGLSHVYEGREGKVPALADISLTVEAGKFVVLVGPSGCGKTSLLMMLAGLRRQSAGTIGLAGRPIPDPDPARVGV